MSTPKVLGLAFAFWRDMRVRLCPIGLCAAVVARRCMAAVLAVSMLNSSMLFARGLGDPIGTVNVFRGALLDGNAAQALSLLAPDVLIYESGGEQRTRDQHTAKHLKADIQYLAGFYVEILHQTSRENDNLAWVTTRSRYLSKSEDLSGQSFSTETIVLRRRMSGWQIVHVH